MQLGVGEIVLLLDPRLVCAVAARMLVAVSVGLMPVFPGVPWRLRGAGWRPPARPARGKRTPLRSGSGCCATPR
jgi:hypothetical protein